MRRIGFLLLAVGVIGIQTITSFAQPVPFLSEEEFQYLASEVSGDAAYEHIRVTTQFHRPSGGAPGLMETARYFEKKAREYGLEEVQLIRQKAPNPGWEATRAELWIVEPEPERLASLLQTPLHLADYSRSADVIAQLVDVGKGMSKDDYEGVDVKNKIVLAWGFVGAVMKEAVVERGAKGLILRPDPSLEQAIYYPDQIGWTSVPYGDEEATFAFVLSHAQGAMLSRRLQDSREPIRVQARVESEFLESWQVMVEGYIKGSEIQDQDVVLSGHLQEEKFSANDNASGCAGTLEVGRALAALIREGRLARPVRNLRFWWVTEFGSIRQYFADHPEESQKILVNINQDMVGADQSQDVLRKQNITRAPFSRSHFLNDVAEAVVDFVVRSNTAEFAKWMAGPFQPYTKPSLYTRPMLSHLGSRHRYNAEMIPFHGNSDHAAFIEAPIGVPAITFMNWPDNYVHTTDDDLWNIDRTQLQRSAFAAAAMAYTIARAGEGEAPAIATEVFARGSRRLAEAFDVALRLIEKSDYRLATNQIRQSVERELKAIRSVGQLATGREDLIQSFAGSLSKLGESYQEELLASYRSVTGDSKEPEIRLTAKETELEGLVPRVVAGPVEFLGIRRKIKGVEGLHMLMAFEILNFIDGERNGLQIYEATVAEALQGGEDYYGSVTPEKVAGYLDNLAEAGVIQKR